MTNYFKAFKILLINIIYSLLFVPVAVIRLLFKARKNPRYVVRLKERFAILSHQPDIIDIWIHTVSVGEFIAAKPLIISILQQNPNFKLLITCTTPTGSELISQFITQSIIQHKNITHIYYPYDSNLICTKFLNIFSPKIAVFFETEIWPKMFRQIKNHNIKLYIINARLSEKSYRGYAKFKNHIKNILNYVDFIAAQSQDDLNRFVKLGYNINNIAVYGNIKYNLTIPSDLQEKSSCYKNLLIGDAELSNRLILIAASTHHGEEEIIIKIYQQLKINFPSLLLIVAPRHPERTQSVYDLCLKYFDPKAIVKFTDVFNQIEIQHDKSSTLLNTPDIFILDTIGQLLYFYNISHVAFIGGSFVSVGGHNPLEPVSLSIASIIGPSYHNFKDIVEDLHQAGGLVIAESEQALQKNIEGLLADKKNRIDLVVNASKFFSNRQQQNVLTKYIELILKN